MTEKYVSPCELPSPYERELLTMLIEECSEVIKRATKAQRFGLDEVQPGQHFTNFDRLSHEVGDIYGIVRMCQDANIVMVDRKLDSFAVAKIEKVHRYLQNEPEVE